MCVTVPPSAGESMPTVGPAVTLGSVTTSVLVAVPTLPAASVAVATTCTGPGAVSVTIARPSDPRATGTPPTVSPSVVTRTSSAAETTSVTALPGATTSGLASTLTTGAVVSAVTVSVNGRVADSP